jgi:DNA repair exonuclease SbcCD ATPase subunit
MPNSENNDSGGIRDQMSQDRDRLSETEKQIQDLRSELKPIQSELEAITTTIDRLSKGKEDLRTHAATLDEAGDILKKDLSEVEKKVRRMKEQMDGVEREIQFAIRQGIQEGVSEVEGSMEEKWDRYLAMGNLVEEEQTRMAWVMNWMLLAMVGTGIVILLSVVAGPFMIEEITGRNLWVGNQDERKIEGWERRQKLEGKMTENEYEQYRSLLEEVANREVQN